MRSIALFALLALFGCGCDHPSFWEFQTRMPCDTTVERLVEVRDHLKSKGYKRIKIDGYNLEGCVIISATEKEEGGVR